MRKFLRAFRRGERGFTLIELLIVVAILGILAAIIVPNVATFMRNGQKGAGQAELAEVQTAVFAMMADNGWGSITGGTVSSGDGQLGSANETINAYLQGTAVERLKGIWTVGTDGFATVGDYPNIAGDHWNYASPNAWTWGQQ